MIDPRPWFPAITSAYALLAGNPGPQLVDYLIGEDLNGPVPQAAILQDQAGNYTVGWAGTRTWEQWVEDGEIAPVDTPYGPVAQGIWSTYKTIRTNSGLPLSTYANAATGGHSRGCPLAGLWAIQFQISNPQMFAMPKLLGKETVAALNLLNPVLYAEAGDVVPFLPLFVDVGLPAPVHLLPPGSGDLAYHHAWATYKDSIHALYSAQAA